MFAETFHFNTGDLPVFTCHECLEEHQAHSEMSHLHEDIEIVSVLKGNIDCKTGEERFNLKKGDICFINKHHLHALYQTGEDSSHRILIIGSELLKKIPSVYNKYIKVFLEDSGFSHVRFTGRDSHAAEINNYINVMEELKKNEEPGYELEMLSIIYKILWHLYNAYVSGSATRPPDNNLLIQEQMMEFIYEHFDEPLTLDEIAEAGNISRSQCSKLFKKYSGMSPISFLNHHRLELSRDMLRSTDNSIADISLSCGFSDQSYYNRLFRKEYGCTPLEYRKSAIRDI